MVRTRPQSHKHSSKVMYVRTRLTSLRKSNMLSLLFLTWCQLTMCEVTWQIQLFNWLYSHFIENEGNVNQVTQGNGTGVEDTIWTKLYVLPHSSTFVMSLKQCGSRQNTAFIHNIGMLLNTAEVEVQFDNRECSTEVIHSGSDQDLKKERKLIIYPLWLNLYA